MDCCHGRICCATKSLDTVREPVYMSCRATPSSGAPEIRKGDRGIATLRLFAAFLTSLTLVASAGTAPADETALAKIGPELRALYGTYRMAQGRPLQLTDPSIQVVEDRVVVDAVASGDVGALRDRLLALGMRSVATAGRIVSGQLPISQIAAMAALPELRFARAAMSTTH
jgi:hypothetical protein